MDGWMDWAGPLLAVPNVTAYPSTASVPITVFLYNGPLLCGFNVPIKWLIILFLILLFFFIRSLEASDLSPFNSVIC